MDMTVVSRPSRAQGVQGCRELQVDAIEHLFDHGDMANAAVATSTMADGELRAWLQSATARVRQRVFPVPHVLAGILPDGGLRPGAVYALSASGALLLSLLAEPSQAGNWCGVVGVPEFGVEAAARAGVELSRLALIPEPKQRWLAATAALADVTPVVAVRPCGQVPAAGATRLAARMREREAVLLVVGSADAAGQDMQWPRVEATLWLSRPHWSGVGQGHGYLTGREVTVNVAAKRFPVPRSVQVLLPGPSGRIEPMEAPTLRSGRLVAVG